MQPNANLLEHLFGTASSLYLCVAGLYIEHWRQVATLKLGVLDEVLGLGRARTLEREEMVSANGYVVLACLGVVVGIILVGDADALGALDEDERYGVVGSAVNILVGFATQVVDA